MDHIASTPPCPLFRRLFVKVLGDITKENFGIDDKVYSSIASVASQVIHIAAAVNSILPYRALRHANTIGA